MVDLCDVKANYAELNSKLEELANPHSVTGVKPGDVVFFWAEVEGDPDNLNMWEDQRRIVPVRIRRDLLRKRLEFPIGGNRRTHLTVFITDNCSKGVVDTAEKSPVNPVGQLLWRALYYGHHGTVDITSSDQDKNQQAFATGGISVFMQAFRQTFDAQLNPKDSLQRDRDSLVDWRTEFFPRLQLVTETIANDEIKTYVQRDNATGKFSLKPAAAGLTHATRDLYLQWSNQGGLSPKLGDPLFRPAPAPPNFP